MSRPVAKDKRSPLNWPSLKDTIRQIPEPDCSVFTVLWELPLPTCFMPPTPSPSIYNRRDLQSNIPLFITPDSTWLKEIMHAMMRRRWVKLCKNLCMHKILLWNQISVAPQIYIFHIYTGPKFTKPTFTQNPDLHKLKFTQLRFTHTQIYTAPYWLYYDTIIPPKMQNKPWFFFAQTWGSQTGGRGPDLGKIPTFSRFFCCIRHISGANIKFVEWMDILRGPYFGLWFKWFQYLRHGTLNKCEKLNILFRNKCFM